MSSVTQPTLESDAKRAQLERMNTLSDAEIAHGKFAHPTRAADVSTRNIEWLWTGFLPLGSLSLIYGHEGDGKSVLTAMIAAQATLGLLPGKLDGVPTNVEMFAFEDDYKAVIKPRLLAAGANLDRVYFHGCDPGLEPLSLPDDAEALACALKDRGSRLAIVDPLTDVLREGLKENSNSDVRKALVPLLHAAESACACILGITHPNKGATEAANKVMGSKAWRSVPRSVLIYGPNPDDLGGDTRILAVSKANYARKRSVKVRVDEVAVEGQDELQPKAKLDGSSAYTDQDVIAAKVGGTIAKTEDTRHKAAEKLLYKLLEDGGGGIEAKAAYAAAEAEGISRATLRRVRSDLDVSGGPTWTATLLPL